MRVCILPKQIKSVVEDLVQRVTKSKDSTALLAVDEEEALVVMTWARYEELLNAANKSKEVVHEHHYPYHKYWWDYPVYTPTWISTTPVKWSYNTTLTGGNSSGVYCQNISDATSSLTFKDLVANISTTTDSATWLDTHE